MKPLDPVWKFFGKQTERLNPETKKNEKFVHCRFCKKNLVMGATRLKKHLAGDQEAGLITLENLDVIKFLENEKKRAQMEQLREISSQQSSQPLAITPFVDAVSSDVNQELDQLLMSAFATGHIPFSFVENEYFRSFIHRIRPAYKLPNRSLLSNEILTDQYNAVKMQVNKKILDAQNIILTTDEW
jgi:hypothetical protein